MMYRSKKRLSTVLFVSLVIVFFSCSKDKGPTSGALVGRWQYQNSTFDTSAAGGHPPVTIYDVNFASIVGETLEFKKGDTIYYSYWGLTTWGNYAVSGNNLILINSAARDTMIIYALTANKLTIGWDNPSYKADLTRQ